MYLKASSIKSRNRKSIIDLTGESLTPKVVSFSQKVDRDDIRDTQLKIEIYCQISVPNYLKNKNNKNIDEAVKIDVKLSDKSIDHYIKKSKQTSAGLSIVNASSLSLSSNNSAKRVVNRSDKRVDLKKRGRQATSSFTTTSMNSRQINTSLLGAENKKRKSLKNIYADCKNAGSISLKNIIELRTVTKNEIYEDSNSVSKTRLEEINNLKSTAFKKSYFALATSGIDPLQMFQTSFGKISFYDKKRGLKRLSKKTSLKKDEFESIFNHLRSKIIGISNSDVKIRTIKEKEEFRLVKTTLDISLKKLESIGEKIHVLLFAKDKSGLNLERKSYWFNIDDIVRQIRKNDVNYGINSARLNSGLSILSLENKTKNEVDLDVHAKKIKKSVAYEKTYFNPVQNILLESNEVIKLRDGIAGGRNKNHPSFVKPSEDVFYRSTLNFNGKKYLNAKSTTDKSKTAKDENIPNCSIYVKTSLTDESVEVFVSNISNNVVKIRPRKYRYNGGVKGDLRDLVVSVDDANNTVNGLSFLKEYVNVRGTKTSFTFKDYGVYRTKKYMYVVECIMTNGEKKIAPAYFIHSYDERSGSVKIDNINITSSSVQFESDNEEVEIGDFVKTVNMTFQIQKIQTEIDKILQNLFGDLFEVFKDDLSKIKDTQGLVYSVEIERINHSTGENETIGKVTADEKGNCSFVDVNCPAFSNVTYSFKPRVAPVTNLIDEINETITSLGNKTIFKSLNYVGAANRARYRSRQKNIYNSVGNKFTKRNMFLKGLIETPKFTLNQKNLDIFLNTETGDVEYEEVSAIEIDSNNLDIEVGNFDIKLVSRLDQEKLFFDISFDIESYDFFVDFYAVFIKEKDEVYLDGAMHSLDGFSQTKRYSYLVDHTGSKGSIEYYIVPFYKDGNFGLPKIVASQIIT